MPIKLSVDTTKCPACDNPLTVLGLRDRLCNSCGVLCRLETDETLRTDQQMRAILSRESVLKETGAKDVRGRW